MKFPYLRKKKDGVIKCFCGTFEILNGSETQAVLFLVMFVLIGICNI